MLSDVLAGCRQSQPQCWGSYWQPLRDHLGGGLWLGVDLLLLLGLKDSLRPQTGPWPPAPYQGG